MENSTLFPTIANAVNTWFEQVFEIAHVVLPRSTWAAVLSNRKTLSAPKTATAEADSVPASDSIVLCMEDGPVIVPYGALSESNYITLIQQAQSIYTQGYRQITVDLSHCTGVKLSGLFALFSIHALLRGETPPDPDHGWHAFRQMVTQSRHWAIDGNVIYKNAAPKVEEILIKNRLLSAH